MLDNDESRLALAIDLMGEVLDLLQSVQGLWKPEHYAVLHKGGTAIQEWLIDKKDVISSLHD